MPRVRLRLFASPREIVGQREMELTLPDGATVGHLLASLYERYPTLRSHEGHLLVSVNQEFASHSRAVGEGDVVAIMPPVSGGAGHGAGEPERSERSTSAVSAGSGEVFVRIQEGAASLDALVERVRDPRAGAVATFVGVVRGESSGERVTALEYEVYEEMAEQELKRLATQAREKFGVLRVALVHRRGRCEVGEPVAWIVVSAAHREPAFEACRWLIEGLKTRIPVWKKEFTLERARWAEGGHGNG